MISSVQPVSIKFFSFNSVYSSYHYGPSLIRSDQLSIFVSQWSPFIVCWFDWLSHWVFSWLRATKHLFCLNLFWHLIVFDFSIQSTLHTFCSLSAADGNQWTLAHLPSPLFLLFDLLFLQFELTKCSFCFCTSKLRLSFDDPFPQNIFIFFQLQCFQFDCFLLPSKFLSENHRHPF